ncbi:hypothetical protein L596_027426 [Steinernema carpocapsae]|uniref:Uncharacterized protein n=1 Tax=Steinernema carpocapsae TaxID=34508 RepID=A0A4U5M4A7_STECR|nr:hypothetical protein L596_027426 [Steinernema carpocapsae]
MFPYVFENHRIPSDQLSKNALIALLFALIVNAIFLGYLLYKKYHEKPKKNASKPDVHGPAKRLLMDV